MNDGGPNGDELELEGIVHEMQKPLARPHGAVEAVMRACTEQPERTTMPKRIKSHWEWFRRPQFTVSPMWATAATAAVLLVVFVLRSPNGRVDFPTGSELIRHQFVLVAPGAREVAVVGDFNGWDAQLTPLSLSGADGLWVGEVELAPGRHLYSFVIDGEEWVTDEGAPRAPDDEFGRPSSVLLMQQLPRGT